jgi:positive regulator of sigma E activity
MESFLMLFILTLFAMLWYRTAHPNASAGELWFMMTIFTGLAYIMGFLEAKRVHKLDTEKANSLAEIEARYAQKYDKA